MTDGGRLLWLVRHAKAASDAPHGGSDHERPLAPRGLRDAAALGRLLASGGVGDDLPQLVLASSARRTTETAERVAAPLGLTVDRRRGLYYGDPVDEIRTVDDAVRSLMIVGHNPATHRLAIDLVGEEEAVASFPTCALALVRVDVARWLDLAPGVGMLVRFLVPPY